METSLQTAECGNKRHGRAYLESLQVRYIGTVQHLKPPSLESGEALIHACQVTDKDSRIQTSDRFAD